jgi:hypothetical protein
VDPQPPKPNTPEKHQPIGGIRGRGEIIEGGRSSRRRKPPYLNNYKPHTYLRDIRWKWPDLFSAFLLLSNNRVVWLGRWGYGATRALRWRCQRDGTGYTIENIKGRCGPLEAAILDNLMLEGMVFASYDSLLEHLSREGLRPESPEDERLISDIRYWIHRRESEQSL